MKACLISKKKRYLPVLSMYRLSLESITLHNMLLYAGGVNPAGVAALPRKQRAVFHRIFLYRHVPRCHAIY